MRKVTRDIVTAFMAGERRIIGNTMTDGTGLWLHGNMIAERKDDGLYINNAGWATSTTKDRLNGLPDVSISQKAGVWYLNGFRWTGAWVRVNGWKGHDSTETMND